jgi:hypothetical protein
MDKAWSKIRPICTTSLPLQNLDPILWKATLRLRELLHNVFPLYIDHGSYNTRCRYLDISTVTVPKMKTFEARLVLDTCVMSKGSHIGTSLAKKSASDRADCW